MEQFSRQKMTKENRNTENPEQKERRLELLQRQGTSLCPNDTRFLIVRHAARLNEDNQRIFWTKVIEMAEAERQERLQQTNRQGNS